MKKHCSKQQNKNSRRIYYRSWLPWLNIVFIKEGISMTGNQLIWLPPWHKAFTDFLKKGHVLKFASLYILSNLEWICLNQLWYILLSTAVTPTWHNLRVQMYCIPMQNIGSQMNIKKLRVFIYRHILLSPITYRHINSVFPWQYKRKKTHISLSQLLFSCNFDSLAPSTNARARLCQRFWRFWLGEASTRRGKGKARDWRRSQLQILFPLDHVGLRFIECWSAEQIKRPNLIWWRWSSARV